MYSLYTVFNNMRNDCIFSNVAPETIVGWFKDKHGKQNAKLVRNKLTFLTHLNDTTYIHIKLDDIMYDFCIRRTK